MRTTLKAFAGIFAVMAFVALSGIYVSAGAAPTLRLDVQFSLKFNQNEANSGTAPIVKYNTSNGTIHSADIIELIGTQLGYGFSDKARLVYENGAFKVTDEYLATPVVVDNALLNLTTNNTNNTMKGQTNADTGKSNYFYNYTATITYGPDNAGNSFTFTGFLAETYSFNPTKTSNTWSRSWTIDGFGNGVREGTKNMQISGGTVKMTGKVTVKIP